MVDELNRGEKTGRVGLDQDVDEDRKEIVGSWRVAALGVLEETDQNLTTLDDAA